MLLFNFYFGYSQVLCGTDKSMQEIEKLHPEVAKRRIETEEVIRNEGLENIAKRLISKYGANAKTEISNSGKTTTTNIFHDIPVVVHVIVPTGAVLGSAYNPTDTQITNWINKTNNIFATTYGYNYYPEGIGNDFGTVIPFRLVLAKKDQNGNTFNGIVRQDGGQITGYNDNGVIKDCTTCVGVDQSNVTSTFPHWNENNYFNIYLVHKINQDDQYQGISGWCNPPYVNNSDYHSFMKMAVLTSIIDNGFVLSHEMGHGLGLLHVFGGNGDDFNCAFHFLNSSLCSIENDHVCDTSPTKTFLTTVLPTNNDINECTGLNYDGIQYNIMNYTSSPRKFTPGQVYRAITFFIQNRGQLLYSPALIDAGYYNIAVSANPTDCGSISGAGLYQPNQNVTLNATSNTGCNFLNWSENGQIISTNSVLSFIANSNRNLTANFQNNNTPQYNISAIYNFDAGSVTGQGLYQELQTVTLTANTNPNYNFLNWSENGAIISTNSTISFTANRNRKVVANFVSNIKSYEYWFDNDFNNRTVINNTSATNSININQNILNLNLNLKLHIFSFRTQDKQGLWSTVTSTYFVNKSKMVAYEYWFNNDYQHKTFTYITPTELLDFSINIDFSSTGIKKGMNVINFRTQDANGVWSIVSSEYFMSRGLITGYEYWCNNDYSNKISVNISETNLLDLNNNIDVNNLNLIVGSNIFNFRAKDNTNNWSSVISTQFNYNGSLGVENIKNENSIKAYPNPIQDFVIIETNSNNIQNLKLYDTNGKILKDEKINNEAKYLLNLQALAQGMYLLEVDSEKSKQIFKIIKK